MQQVAPAAGRAARARIQPQLDLDDEDEYPRVGRQQRFDDGPSRPWWRPASRAGKAFLAAAALLIAGGFITGIVLLRNFLEHDSRFRIGGAGNIQATGLVEVTRPEMLPVFGEDIGRNIFFVPLAERRRELEKLPWVQHATVMRFLPDQIRVDIVERQPVAFVREGQQVGLVDASGVLLPMSAAAMAKHHYSFPVVTGIDARDPLAGRKARMDVYQRLLAELDGGGRHFSEQISEIDLTDPEDARVLMPEPGADILAHFGEDRFLDRYQRYEAHIAEWRQQYPRLAAVDLRYDQQVVLKMTGGATAPQALADGTGAAKANDVPADAKPSPAQPADAQGEMPAAKEPAKSHEKKPAEKTKKKRMEPHHAAENAGKKKPHVVAGHGQ